MLMIDVELQPSEIHGLGIFTKEPLKQGQLIWQEHPRVDQLIPRSELNSLSAPFIKHLEFYGYQRIEDGEWMLNSDMAKFTNHSKNPTSIVGEDGCCYAAFDMPAGTEITEDYTTFAIGGCVDAVK